MEILLILICAFAIGLSVDLAQFIRAVGLVLLVSVRLSVCTSFPLSRMLKPLWLFEAADPSRRSRYQLAIEPLMSRSIICSSIVPKLRRFNSDVTFSIFLPQEVSPQVVYPFFSLDLATFLEQEARDGMPRLRRAEPTTIAYGQMDFSLDFGATQERFDVADVFIVLGASVVYQDMPFTDAVQIILGADFLQLHGLELRLCPTAGVQMLVVGKTGHLVSLASASEWPLRPSCDYYRAVPRLDLSTIWSTVQCGQFQNLSVVELGDHLSRMSESTLKVYLRSRFGMLQSIELD